MSTLNFYCIYDSTAAVYYPPFTFKIDQQAIRAFAVTMDSPNSNMSLFPQDYSLYCLGSFDEITGMLQPLKNPRRVITAMELKEPADAPDLSLVNNKES